LNEIDPFPGQLSGVGVAEKLKLKQFTENNNVAKAKLLKIKFFTRQ
jgi:hypothetical protein